MASVRNGGRQSTTQTADDRAYSAWAAGQAAEAGVRNPMAYVNRNVNAANSGAGTSNRNRVVSAINRGNR